MTITNHVVAGAVIGIAVGQPIVAIVLAFASHFLMDALPHFGYAGNKGFTEVLKHRLSYAVGIITLISTIAVIVLLAINGAWFAILTGIVAASPDAVGWYNYVAFEKKGNSAKSGLALLHVKYHRRIQMFERPWGIYIEIVAFVLLSLLLLRVL